MTLDYVDSLYDARQDGRLTNNALLILLRRGEISQWTYERLLSLKPVKEDNAA